VRDMTGSEGWGIQSKGNAANESAGFGQVGLCDRIKNIDKDT
jgi:hypothetical protein